MLRRKQMCLLQASVVAGLCILVGGCKGFFDDVASHIDIEPSVAVLVVGQSINLNATEVKASGAKLDITDSAEWTSSSSIVTAKAGGSVKAVKVGQTHVQAKLDSGVGDSLVIVAQSRLISLDVAPADRTVPAGSASIQYSAQAVFADGSTDDLTNYVQWGSSNSGVCSISSDGKATPGSPGKSTISAAIHTADGIVVDSVHLTVE